MSYQRLGIGVRNEDTQLTCAIGLLTHLAMLLLFDPIELNQKGMFFDPASKTIQNMETT